MEHVAPRLWVKRLSILESRDLKREIGTIFFETGLNCVVGRSSRCPDDDAAAPAIAGHSVGKTSMCRLLRYCLGEKRFATEDGEEAIHNTWPHAWVAAEIFIGHMPWTVLRPLGGKANSLAAQGKMVDVLASATLEGFGAYCTTLEAFIPPYLHRSDIHFQWLHLLSWLSRDQESRLHCLYEWRAEESESETPSFPKPVVHPNYLMSGILGLISQEFARLTDERQMLESALESLKNKEKLTREAPTYKHRFAKERLIEIIGNFEESSAQGHMFSAESVAGQKLDATEALLKAKRKSLDALENERSQWQSKIQGLQKSWGELDDLLEVLAPSPNENTTVGLEEKRQRKKIIEDHIAQQSECAHIPVRLGECTHIKMWLDNCRLLRFDEQSREAQLKAMSAEKRAEFEAFTAKREQQKKQYAQASEKIRWLDGEKSGLQSAIETYIQEKTRIENALREYLDAHAELNGKKTESELASVHAEIQQIGVRLQDIKNQQGNVKASQHEHVTAFKSLFDRTVKQILGKHFAGKLREKDGKWLIDIFESGRNSGQTYRTIGHILFDVAAALFTQQDEGHHPGLLIFDSPRETDMDDDTYARFLLAFNALATLSGGSPVPIQCILTTTTPPPEELTNTIRDELAAYPSEKLLFKKELSGQGSLLEDLS